MTDRACDFGLGSKEKHHFSLKMQIQKTSCLKCNKHGDTLVCNNWDCPIVVHESCLPSTARFDDTGSFYCPYCLYKKSLVECHQAKAKALLANRALVSFMDMRTRNDAGHLINFKNLKRKEPDAPTNIKKRDDAKVECNGLHQPMQVEGGHQDDSHILETLFCNQQQAGLRRGHYLGKGSAAKDDGNLTEDCQVSVKEVEKYKSGRLEEVQTQDCLTKEDSTKENREKSGNRSDGMLHNDHFMEMEMKMKEKLTNTGQPHEIRDCGIKDEDKLQVKLPQTDVLPTREDTVLVALKSRNLTYEHEETANTVEEYFNLGEERDQTQIDFQETPRCLTITNTYTLERTENLYKGNECTFQDDCSVRTQVVENFDRPGETEEDLNGRTDRGESKAKTAVHSTRNDRESLPHGGLGNSTTKHLEIAQIVEKYHDRVMEKVQTQKEPEETSVYCIKEDSCIVIKEKPDGINDRTYQDDCSVVRQLMVNSGNAHQYVGVGKYQCRRTDDERTNFKSPIKPSYSTREGNESGKHEKSGSPIKENKDTSKLVEQYFNGRVEKEQTQEESQQGCVCLTMEDTTAITEELDEVKDSAFGDKMVKNSENADQPAEVGKDFYGSAGGIKTQGKALQNVVYRPREKNAAVTHELGNLTRKHLETKKTLEGYHDTMAETGQTQTNLQSTGDDDKKVMAEESDAENYSSSHCGTTDEGKTRVKSLKNTPQTTRNVSVSVSCEEFSSADESSNTNYLEHGNNAAQKGKMQKNLKNRMHREFSGNSENEVEEHELPTHGESRHKVESIKQIQRSTILPAARRRKLPWTAQEVEMLKEGVQKFSLTANKNLPWMKILEFGRHIFDGTRIPADLKDKWKNIQSKENADFDAT